MEGLVTSEGGSGTVLLVEANNAGQFGFDVGLFRPPSISTRIAVDIPLEQPEGTSCRGS